jgi:hypothetical protein
MRTILLFFFAFLPFLLSAQNIIYVKQNASNNGTGLSWQSSLPNLSVALTLAQYGDTIKVAGGIYKPTSDNSRDSSFHLKNGVKLLGGYLGAGLTPNSRDFDLHPSILSGDIGLPNDSTDNSYHVVSNNQTLDENTLFDGFKLQFGNANIIGDGLRNSGGGIFLFGNASNIDFLLKITNCNFKNNNALAGAGALIKSLYFGNKCNPKIENCIFEKNFALFASGLNITISENIFLFCLNSCIFRNNTSNATGSALFIEPNGVGKFIIENCSFLKNKSISGGIITTFSYNGSPSKNIEITKSKFQENTGASSLIELEYKESILIDEVSFLNEKASIFDCTFNPFTDSIGKRVFSLKNSSFKNVQGSVLGLNGFSKIDLFNNQFENLQSTILHTVSDSSNTICNIKHCLFNRNKSLEYGFFTNTGLYNYSTSNNTIFDNCFFANNLGSFISNYYIPNFVTRIRPTFNYCTFYNNKSQDSLLFNNSFIDSLNFNSCIFTDDDPKPSTLDIGGNYANFSHCLFADSSGQSWIPLNNPTQPIGFESNNIFGQKAIFEDTSQLNFRLTPCSPGINKGDPNACRDSVDYYENTRISNDIPDIGASETAIVFGLDTILGAISCANEPYGKVSFSGNFCPTSYQWQSGSIVGNGIDALESGDYTMTISDINGLSFDFQFSIPDNTIPITFDLDTIVAASGTTIANGSIILMNINGGVSPYIYSWTNDVNTLNNINVLPGFYSLGVTDAIGCREEFTWEVPFILSDDSPAYVDSFTIFPNLISTNHPLKIYFKPDEINEIGCFNGIGQLVFNDKISNSENNYLILPFQTQGIYFVYLKNKQNKIFVKRIYAF